MQNNLIVGYAGLSHLGLCSMIATANLGIKTYGFDFNEVKIRNLNNYKIDISEPNLIKYLKKIGSSVHAKTFFSMNFASDKKGIIELKVCPSPFGYCSVQICGIFNSLATVISNSQRLIILFITSLGIAVDSFSCMSIMTNWLFSVSAIMLNSSLSID